MTLRDRRARDAIAHALDQNLMVLAGAGAGKTYALVQRMVNAVQTGGVEVDRMAAITFTRKAAGEMRGRFFSALKARAEEADGEALGRVQRALEKVDQCFIGTIHAFCGQLLRERPVEAGLPPDFSEVAEREEAVMRREAWDRFVQRCFLAEDARLARLEDLGLRPEDLYGFFQRRCQFSDVPLAPGSTHKPDLSSAVSKCEAFLAHAEAHIPDPLPGKRDPLQTALKRARLFFSNRKIKSDADRITLLQMLGGKLGVTLKSWAPNGDFAKALRDGVLPEFQTEILAPTLAQWRQYVYQFASAFVDEAVGEYAETRRESGRLTFQDLLELAARLLRDHPEVRRHFQDRYRCLFVDEFQDTDPIQAEMVLYLTGEDLEETDWRELAARPGSLFLVGDGKQSIYRFRRADVETFDLVRKRVVDTGGRVVDLNTSFRSFGTLCDWINAAFEPLFAAHENRYRAEFAPLFKSRPEGRDEFAVRRISIAKIYRNNRGQIASQDAERIANFIAAALKGETEFNGTGEDAALGPRASPGDFLILTRTSGYLSDYAQALEARGIPFDITGGNRLGEAEVLHALADFLEAVYMPDNPLPLLAYLRGDLVGAGDDALYAFKKAGGVFNWTCDLPKGVDAAWHPMFEQAFDHLKKASKWLQSLSPGAAIARCVDMLGLLPFVRALPMGATQAGNLVRALALINEWSAAGLHWGQVMAELRALIHDKNYKVEQMTLASGQEGVVRLMNLHQAKGLQGKIVFLADPYDTSYTRYGPEFHVSRTEEEPFLALPIAKSRGPYAREVVAEPVDWETAEAEEARFIAGEELRLLYVAATRAENLLIVSTYDEKPNDGPWAPLYPYMKHVPELTRYPTAEAPPLKTRSVAIQRDRFWRGIQKESFEVALVTDDRADVTDLDGAGGRADSKATYGTVIHRILDDAINNRLPADPTSYVKHRLDEAGAGPEFLPHALDALQHFRNSEIWAELRASERVYTEVPFAISQPEKIIRGVIDLVYDSPEGWKLVDYKTHAVKTDQDVRALCEQTARQVNAYAEHWANFTGEPVAAKGLWLTEQTAFVEIEDCRSGWSGERGGSSKTGDDPSVDL